MCRERSFDFPHGIVNKKTDGKDTGDGEKANAHKDCRKKFHHMLHSKTGAIIAPVLI
jgi:hypothetical protein